MGVCETYWSVGRKKILMIYLYRHWESTLTGNLKRVNMRLQAVKTRNHVASKSFHPLLQYHVEINSKGGQDFTYPVFYILLLRLPDRWCVPVNVSFAVAPNLAAGLVGIISRQGQGQHHQQTQHECYCLKKEGKLLNSIGNNGIK